MALGFLKKLLGVTEKESTANIVEGASSIKGGQADPVKFVEFMVSNLVAQPQSVKVESNRDGDETLEILIICDKSDMGRVIGKRGKTISAIRSLAIDAASRLGIRNLKVELQD